VILCSGALGANADADHPTSWSRKNAAFNGGGVGYFSARRRRHGHSHRLARTAAIVKDAKL